MLKRIGLDDKQASDKSIQGLLMFVKYDLKVRPVSGYIYNALRFYRKQEFSCELHFVFSKTFLALNWEGSDYFYSFHYTSNTELICEIVPILSYNRIR